MHCWFETRDRSGETPFSRALQTGAPELIGLFMRERERNAEGTTCLQRSAYWGLAEAVNKLLEAGDMPDERDEDGETPIIRAARNGHYDTARVLLERGADPNETDANGLTALHWVALNGHEAIAELLLAHGAEVNRREKCVHGLTPTGLALVMGYEDLVTLMTCTGGRY